MKKILIAVAFVLSALPASADSLTLPTAAFLGTAAMDWTTTYRNLSRGAVESNPMFKMANDKPFLTTSLVAGTDIGIAYLAKKIKDAGHPKLAIAGLVTLTVLRASTVHHNFETAKRYP